MLKRYVFAKYMPKAAGMKRFGAKEVIAADTVEKLKPWKGGLDYMLSTVPYVIDATTI